MSDACTVLRRLHMAAAASDTVDDGAGGVVSCRAATDGGGLRLMTAEKADCGLVFSVGLVGCVESGDTFSLLALLW